MLCYVMCEKKIKNVDNKRNVNLGQVIYLFVFVYFLKVVTKIFFGLKTFEQ